jgi:hypothetical protein
MARPIYDYQATLMIKNSYMTQNLLLRMCQHSHVIELRVNQYVKGVDSNLWPAP